MKTKFINGTEYRCVTPSTVFSSKADALFERRRLKQFFSSVRCIKVPDTEAYQLWVPRYETAKRYTRQY